jgi:hypothetical protein
VTALVSKMEVQPPVAKLMKMLADRGRLDLVPTMSEVYAERFGGRVDRLHGHSVSPLNKASRSSKDRPDCRNSGQFAEFRRKFQVFFAGRARVSAAFHGHLRQPRRKGRLETCPTGDFLR